MGKRGAYSCPVQGCPKTGTLSSLQQHIRAVHPNCRHLTPEQIRSAIVNKEKYTMGVTIERDGDRKGLHTTSLLFGVVLGVVGTLILLSGSCYFGMDYGQCPAAIQDSSPTPARQR
jgi:hypothetical protein